jgi:lysophospholipase L1-like esterase
MRIRLVSMSVLVMLWGSVLAHADAEPTYYLALGDSLSQGIQPLGPAVNGQNTDIETNQGYVDDLYALLHLRTPGLKLAKLGCPGETILTMLNGGGPCTYVEGSQLAAAVSFLETNKVDLVTLDVGANDVDKCISLTGINGMCFSRALSDVGSDHR